MPRQARREMAGYAHHVFNRGNNRGLIFLDEDDRNAFLAHLLRISRELGWRLLSFCLIANHFHFAVETPEPNLGVGMKELGEGVARRLHAKRGSSGRVFGDRFHSIPIDSNGYLCTLLRYIALNPVNHDLCENPAAWHWSSHSRLIAGVDDGIVDVWRVAELLSAFGGDPLGRYGRLIDPHGEWGPWSNATRPDFPCPPLLEILERTDDLDQAMRDARFVFGYTLTAIAKALDVSRYVVANRINGACT